MSAPNKDTAGFKRHLPPIGSPAYHVMLGAVAIFILGPLGGISAAFMNFSIGFFIGGQVLAGILGSTVTLPYGPDGKHGANYMQTMAASVAGMCGMAVLIQAMVWLGLPEPPAWKLILYFLCIGMFGVGIGMLYTPILVDRMQLSFPSGFAVANILRALTDKELLKRSIAKLGGGMGIGYLGGIAALKVSAVGAINLSTSTVGAGMIVGPRIAIPALVVALIGIWQTPYLRSIGWLEPDAPFRKIGFIIALGTILGAAMLDIILILIQAGKQYLQRRGEPAPAAEDWKRVNLVNLVVWVLFWGSGTVIVGSQVLHQPVFFLAVAVGLCFLFVLVNGISLGLTDWNPISSAFVMTVFILAAVGLRDPGVGLMCASILLIACSEGGDMQQDRSTGWRLGTNRVVQFRYQVIGIAMGAVLAVVLAKTFMSAYPVLRADQFANPHLEGAQQWQSAMTYKFVGALKGITTSQPHVMKALWFGLGLGLLIEAVRKLVKRSRRYQDFRQGSRTGRVTDFLFDAIFVASPYASSFGGFVELPTVLWWTAGGLIPAAYEFVKSKLQTPNAQVKNGALPEDMSTMSLVGGGLIAGDSLAALSMGIFGLVASGALKSLFSR
jgi:uncharacterized oligopeptide transporter (OPT) family protein